MVYYSNQYGIVDEMSRSPSPAPLYEYDVQSPEKYNFQSGQVRMDQATVHAVNADFNDKVVDMHRSLTEVILKQQQDIKNLTEMLCNDLPNDPNFGGGMGGDGGSGVGGASQGSAIKREQQGTVEYYEREGYTHDYRETTRQKLLKGPTVVSVVPGPRGLGAAVTAQHGRAIEIAGLSGGGALSKHRKSLQPDEPRSSESEIDSVVRESGTSSSDNKNSSSSSEYKKTKKKSQNQRGGDRHRSGRDGRRGHHKKSSSSSTDHSSTRNSSGQYYYTDGRGSNSNSDDGYGKMKQHSAVHPLSGEHVTSLVEKFEHSAALRIPNNGVRHSHAAQKYDHENSRQRGKPGRPNPGDRGSQGGRDNTGQNGPRLAGGPSDHAKKKKKDSGDPSKSTSDKDKDGKFKDGSRKAIFVGNNDGHNRNSNDRQEKSSKVFHYQKEDSKDRKVCKASTHNAYYTNLKHHANRADIEAPPPINIMVRCWDNGEAHLYEISPTWVFDVHKQQWIAELNQKLDPKFFRGQRKMGQTLGSLHSNAINADYQQLLYASGKIVNDLTGTTLSGGFGEGAFRGGGLTGVTPYGGYAGDGVDRTQDRNYFQDGGRKFLSTETHLVDADYPMERTMHWGLDYPGKDKNLWSDHRYEPLYPPKFVNMGILKAPFLLPPNNGNVLYGNPDYSGNAPSAIDPASYSASRKIISKKSYKDAVAERVAHRQRQAGLGPQGLAPPGIMAGTGGNMGPNDHPQGTFPPGGGGFNPQMRLSKDNRAQLDRQQQQQQIEQYYIGNSTQALIANARARRSAAMNEAGDTDGIGERISMAEGTSIENVMNQLGNEQGVGEGEIMSEFQDRDAENGRYQDGERDQQTIEQHQGDGGEYEQGYDLGGETHENYAAQQNGKFVQQYNHYSDPQGYDWGSSGSNISADDGQGQNGGPIQLFYERNENAARTESKSNSPYKGGPQIGLGGLFGQPLGFRQSSTMAQIANNPAIVQARQSLYSNAQSTNVKQKPNIWIGSGINGMANASNADDDAAISRVSSPEFGPVDLAATVKRISMDNNALAHSLTTPNIIGTSHTGTANNGTAQDRKASRDDRQACTSMRGDREGRQANPNISKAQAVAEKHAAFFDALMGTRSPVDEMLASGVVVPSSENQRNTNGNQSSSNQRLMHMLSEDSKAEAAQESKVNTLRSRLLQLSAEATKISGDEKRKTSVDKM